MMCDKFVYYIAEGSDFTPRRTFYNSLQSELTTRDVSLHNQKLALESMVKEIGDARKTIQRFRCVGLVHGYTVILCPRCGNFRKNFHLLVNLTSNSNVSIPYQGSIPNSSRLPVMIWLLLSTPEAEDLA